MDKVSISTNFAPQAIGPYSQAVRMGNLLFLSGQIPVDPKTGEMVSGSVEEQAKQVVKAPGVDARPLPVWGFYARNVQNLFFDNVSLRCEKPDARPVLMFDNISKLRMENLIFDHFTNVVKTVVSTNVSEIISSDKGNKF